jgi:hypothetical protein
VGLLFASLGGEEGAAAVEVVDDEAGVEVAALSGRALSPVAAAGAA